MLINKLLPAKSEGVEGSKQRYLAEKEKQGAVKEKRGRKEEEIDKVG